MTLPALLLLHEWSTFYDSNVYPAQLVKNYNEKSKKRVIMKMDDIIRQALL